MAERVWGIRRKGRNSSAHVWYGYWRSRADALAYLTRHCGDMGDGGELASVNSEWCAVEPIEWVDGRDTQLRIKRRSYPIAYGLLSNAGGDDG